MNSFVITLIISFTRPRDRFKFAHINSQWRASSGLRAELATMHLNRAQKQIDRAFICLCRVHCPGVGIVEGPCIENRLIFSVSKSVWYQGIDILTCTQCIEKIFVLNYNEAHIVEFNSQDWDIDPLCDCIQPSPMPPKVPLDLCRYCYACFRLASLSYSRHSMTQLELGASFLGACFGGHQDHMKGFWVVLLPCIKGIYDSDQRYGQEIFNARKQAGHQFAKLGNHLSCMESFDPGDLNQRLNRLVQGE